MAYKFDEARAAGVSDTDIVDHLKQSGTYTYKFDEARAAGVSDTDIVDHLENQTTPEVTKKVTADLEVDLPEYVEPEDSTTTSPVSMDLSTISLENPKYVTKLEGEAQDVEEAEKAQELATTSSFPQTYKITSGELRTTEPEGLGDRSLDAIPIGKLALFNLLPESWSVKLAAKGFKALDLSKEAQYIISRNPMIDEKLVFETLQNIPKKDQAKALANSLGSEGFGYTKQAVVHDTDRILVGNEAKRRKLALLDSINSGSFDIDMNIAATRYTDMVEEIGSTYKNLFDASKMTESVDFLEKFYGTTPSKANTIVSKMKAILDENPKINLSEALEFRQDLNYLLGKATRGKEKVKLKTIKANVDKFISDVTTPAQKQKMDDVIFSYGQATENLKLDELIKKSTTKDGVAIDWTKLKESLDSKAPKSNETKIAINIVEAMEKKFKNDPSIATLSHVVGSNEEAGGMLAAYSFVVNKFKNIFALYGNRYENLKIQNAILKSIRKSRTNLDFVDDIVNNTKLPDEIKSIFTPKQIPYKPGAADKPLTATAKGTVSEDISAGILRENSDELISDFITKASIKGDNVVAKAQAVKNSVRINNILRDTAKRMKVDDAKGNMDMLETIVTREAESLVKEINRQVGAVLPSAEANKIIRLRLKELMKECE